MTSDLFRFLQSPFAREFARVALTGALPLGLAVWLALAIRTYGIAAMGFKLANALERLAAWIRRVCNSMSYAGGAFRWHWTHQKRRMGEQA